MSAGIAVRVLGPLRVRTDAEWREVRGTRLQTLLAVLSLAAGREVARADLLEALWDDSPPKAPGNALQALVSRLRRSLSGLDVRASPTGYQLALPRESVDALLFTSLLPAVGAEHDPVRRAARLREALALWHGPALAGLAPTRAVRAHATRLEELRRHAHESRIDADLAVGRGEELVTELTGIVSSEPFREKARVQLMRALHAGGRQTEALAVYEDARGLLAESYGIDPSAELQQAHLDVLRGAETPPPPRLARLPTPLTPLIGREDEVARLERMLSESRLVTLTGPGGVGKTRVAWETARRVAAHGTERLCVVDLAPLTGPGAVPGAILDALGAVEGGLLSGAGFGPTPGDALRRLTAMLAEIPVLLVVDHCEHLAGETAEAAVSLLAWCPRLRLLAVGRQALGVSGERQHRLPGLAVPQGKDDDPADAPAVRLFVDRAEAVRPGFAPGEHGLNAVAAICRALDGLPLALELAAARLTSLSVRQIRERLNDRFRLLGTEGRTAGGRQRTLRAVVDWTWDLLDANERTLARRLAVFAGRVEPPLAEQVCAGDGLDPADLDPLLASLVAKSVVHAEESGGSTGFRMPETVRLYAAERLAAAGEEHAVWLRYAEALLRIAEAAEPKLRGGTQVAELAALTALVDDFHAALRWSLSAAPPELSTRLTAALEWFWLLSGRRAQGAEWTDRALELRCDSRPAERALVCTIGALHRGALLGREEGARHLAEALRLIREHGLGGHPVLSAAPVLDLLRSGRPEQAGEMLRSLASDPDPWTAALARLLGSRLLANAGEPRAARAELLAARDAFRTLGERLGLIYTLSALAEAESAAGDHVAAVGSLRQALRAVAELESAEDRPMLLVRLGVALRLAEQPTAAVAELREAEAEATRLGCGEARGAAHHALGEVHRAAGRTAEARQLLDRALAEVTEHGTGIGYRPAVLTSQGHLALAEGRLSAALEACETALGLASEVGEAQLASRVLVLASDIALAQARPASAAALLHTATAIRGQPLDETDPDVRRATHGARRALGGERYEAVAAVPVDGVGRLVRGLAEE